MKKVLLAAVLVVVASVIAQTATKSVTAVAMDDPELSMFVNALKETGLDKTLDAEKGPYTVFAPTNAAFNKVPKATLDALMADKAKLTKVLQYHIISGDKGLMAADVGKMDGQASKTLGGGELTVAAKDGKVSVNNANVTKVDLAASNGVIHLIDTVLIPEGL